MNLDGIAEYDDESIALEEAWLCGILTEDAVKTIESTINAAIRSGEISGLNNPQNFAKAIDSLNKDENIIDAVWLLISCVPDDIIGKSLENIYRLAPDQKNKKEICEKIEFIYKNLNGKSLSQYMNNLLNNIKEATKIRSKSSRMNSILRFLQKKFDMMSKALENFVINIENKHKSLNFKSNNDMPAKYTDDLAAGIDGTYRKMLKSSPTDAMKYKQMVRRNAEKKGLGSAHHNAYNKVFFDKIAEI